MKGFFTSPVPEVHRVFPYPVRDKICFLGSYGSGLSGLCTVRVDNKILTTFSIRVMGISIGLVVTNIFGLVSCFIFWKKLRHN